MVKVYNLVIGIAFVLYAFAAQAADIELKVDRVTLNSPSTTSGTISYTQITFAQAFSTVPAVFILGDDSDSAPVNVKLVEVTTTGFTVAVVHPINSAGQAQNNQFHYWAAEPGDYQVGNLKVHVNTVSTQAAQRKSFGSFNQVNQFETITLNNYGSSRPAILAEVQSINNHTPPSPPDFTQAMSPWFSATIFNVNETPNNSGNWQFRLSLDTAETGSLPTVNETVAYAVIEAQNNGSFTSLNGDTINFKSLITSDTVTGNCTSVTLPGSALTGSQQIVLSNKASRDGVDGGWTRLCSYSGSQVFLRVQEDQTNDSDVGHTTERMSLLVFAQPFVLQQSGLQMQANSGTVNIPPPPVTGSLSFTQVNFPRPFASQPYVFAMPTDAGNEPANVRIKEVTVNGFKIAQFEPQDQVGTVEGLHESMVVDYIAATAGNHTLEDGTRIHVGQVATNEYRAANNAGVPSTGSEIINISPAFNSTPVVLAQVQTVNNSPSMSPAYKAEIFLAEAMLNRQPNSIEIALERLGAVAVEGQNTLTNETLAWLAMEPGNGSFKVNNGSNILYLAKETPVNINGFDDSSGCFVNSLNSVFSSVPYAIAGTATRNGGDGSWLRRCALSNNSIGLFVDEDQATDTERSHGSTEAANIIAFSQAFEWCPAEVNITRSVDVEDDGVSASNDKAISGATVINQLSVENSGCLAVDDNGTVLVQAIPAEMDLFLGDFNGAGGLLSFSDGSVSSGLTLDFTALTSTADGVEFSQDGSNYSYQPTPDANGYDANVRFIRITMQGDFAAVVGNGSSPSFQLNYRMRIK